MEKESGIVRSVELIIGCGNIGKCLGLRASSVLKMYAAGAPIIKRGKRGDLVCEKAEIWEWCKRNHEDGEIGMRE